MKKTFLATPEGQKAFGGLMKDILALLDHERKNGHRSGLRLKDGKAVLTRDNGETITVGMDDL